MSWTGGPLTVEPYVGFVYLVTEKSTGMKYIGSKRYWAIDKKKPGKFKMVGKGEFLHGKDGKRVLETRTVNRNTRVETDWKTYNTSNKIMHENLKNTPDNYTKEIIRSCTSLSEMKGYEAYLQLDWYFNKDWSKLYNKMVNVRMKMKTPSSDGTKS